MKAIHFTVLANAPDPTDYYEAVLKTHSAFATATAVVDGEVTVLDWTELKTEDLVGLRASIGLDKNVTFWMTDALPSKEDTQPFPLLSNVEDIPFMMGFLEGNFTQYAKADSSFTNAYHAFQDYLVDKINIVVEQVATKDSNIEDDVKAACNILNQEAVKKDVALKLFGGERGVFTLVAAKEGETAYMNQLKNDVGHRFDWGWTSDHCGTVQPVAAAANAADKYKNKYKQRAEPAVGVAADKSTSVEELCWIKPGKLVQGNTMAKDWYGKVFGIKIDEKTVPPGMTLASVLRKDKIQIPKERLAELRTLKLEFEVVTDTDPKSGADTSTKNIPSGGSAVPLPLMGQTSLKKVSGLFTEPKSLGASLVDGSSPKILTSDKIKAVRDKHPTWFQQLAKENPDLAKCADDSVFWPYDIFETIAFADSKGMAILAWNLACRAAMAEDEINLLKGGSARPGASSAANADKPTLQTPAAAADKYKKRAKG